MLLVALMNLLSLLMVECNSTSLGMVGGEADDPLVSSPLSLSV